MSQDWRNDGITHFISDSAFISYGTRIWHYAVVLDDAWIGFDCSIGACCEIGRGAIIGDQTRIGHGVFLPGRSRIGKRVFIGPGVIFTDDRHPVVNNPDYFADPPVVEDDVSIGAGAVILPGVTLHKGARIGAGAVVTKDVPSNSLVYGEAARQR